MPVEEPVKEGEGGKDADMGKVPPNGELAS